MRCNGIRRAAVFVAVFSALSCAAPANIGGTAQATCEAGAWLAEVRGQLEQLRGVAYEGLWVGVEEEPDAVAEWIRRKLDSAGCTLLDVGSTSDELTALVADVYFARVHTRLNFLRLELFARGVGVEFSDDMRASFAGRFFDAMRELGKSGRTVEDLCIDDWMKQFLLENFSQT